MEVASSPVPPPTETQVVEVKMEDFEKAVEEKIEEIKKVVEVQETAMDTEVKVEAETSSPKPPYNPDCPVHGHNYKMKTQRTRPSILNPVATPEAAGTVETVNADNSVVLFGQRYDSRYLRHQQTKIRQQELKIREMELQIQKDWHAIGIRFLDILNKIANRLRKD